LYIGFGLGASSTFLGMLTVVSLSITSAFTSVVVAAGFEAEVTTGVGVVAGGGVALAGVEVTGAEAEGEDEDV
jgi:hypothetical protein